MFTTCISIISSSTSLYQAGFIIANFASERIFILQEAQLLL